MWLKPKFSKNSVGLGLRREFFFTWEGLDPTLQFLEIAPENWLAVGGRRKRRLKYFAEQYPLVCHGLSLSLGGERPLNYEHLQDLKTFFSDWSVALYSEHLSFCDDATGYLYELLPLPLTEKAAQHCAARIADVQSVLDRRIAIENISYYALPDKDMSELDFLLDVLERSDCALLLDVNNVYVNSQNHGYNPFDFIDALPTKRIAYLHMAGHERQAERILDTHGAPIANDVWSLLDYTYERHGLQPTCLERDNDVPAIDVLKAEWERIRHHQQTVCPHVAELA